MLLSLGYHNAPSRLKLRKTTKLQQKQRVSIFLIWLWIYAPDEVVANEIGGWIWFIFFLNCGFFFNCNVQTCSFRIIHKVLYKEILFKLFNLINNLLERPNIIKDNYFHFCFFFIFSYKISKNWGHRLPYNIYIYLYIYIIYIIFYILYRSLWLEKIF